MSKINKLNLSDAMLQRGKTPEQHNAGSNISPQVLPVSEMAMVLMLPQLRPNPDNPRTSKNPRYDDIKASIRSRGLDSIPKVTKDPEDSSDVYIFSDGGNTRYQILCELWEETGEDRFYRIQTFVKPWPGRFKCLVGHLAENEVRGDLTFIEKALGIHNARSICEEKLGKSVSLRELSDLLNQEGYPVHSSTISRMEDTLKYLYSDMPDLLESGLSRSQVMPLLAIRSTAEKIWDEHCSYVDTTKTYGETFSTTCRVFNNPDLYSLEMFRDELIGELLKALPHPALNYDRWLIELDPKEQQRRIIYGDPPKPPVVNAPSESPELSQNQTPQNPTSGNVVTQLTPQPDETTHLTGLRPGTLTGAGTRSEPSLDADAELPVPELPFSMQTLTDGNQGQPGGNVETQPDLYGGPPVISGLVPGNESFNTDSLHSALSEPTDETERFVSSVAFAATGLEPVNDIWHVSALQDDIEHLQDMAYRLAFELAEAMGCEANIYEDKTTNGAGYSVPVHSGNEFVLFLAGLTGVIPDQPFNMFMFCLNFIGSSVISEQPVFDDIHLVKMMRLIRVLRRLRELQRDASKGDSHDL